MKVVVVQKIDLDTALAAFLLDVSASDQIVLSRGEGPPEVLANPQIVCIEAGGSGRTDLNNFDHHNEGGHLPPACEQAYHSRIDHWGGDSRVKRLVEYVAKLDGGERFLCACPFPVLSSVFSGMLLCERNLVTQLFKGIEIFAAVLEKEIDPFGVMPPLPEWEDWIGAKRANDGAAALALERAEYFTTSGGLRGAFLESECAGGAGALYEKGCRVVVLFNPRFGDLSIPKFTIAGNGFSVYHLASIFNRTEEGWGGRGSIIGSPRNGTVFRPDEVIKVVEAHL